MGDESTDEHYIQTGSTRLDTPLRPATLDCNGLEINRLLAITDDVTLDYDFGSTANHEPSTAYIDGMNGTLHYRGRLIEELARESGFIEVTYLSIYGELLDRATLGLFTHRVRHSRLLSEDFLAFFGAFSSEGHPMSMLQARVAGLATYYEDTLDPLNPEQLGAVTFQLLGGVPTMVAMIVKRAEGLPTLYPDFPRELTEDLIHITSGLSYQSYDINPVLTHALGTLFILHADHEQNCPTSIMCFAGSLRANLYTLMASAIDVLSGPLYGGTNGAVLRMLMQMEDTDMAVAELVKKVKTKAGGVKLMGFGHRTYRSYDPCAAIVKEFTHDVPPRLGKADRLLDLTLELEEVALSGGYFVSRHLYLNADFYTGLIHRAMGFRVKMFAPLSATGWLPGWIAQYREMIINPSARVTRPRRVYVGAAERHYRQKSAGS